MQNNNNQNNNNQNDPNNNNQNNPRNNPRMAPKRPKIDIMFILVVGIMIVLVFMLIQNFTRRSPEVLTYDQIVTYVKTEKISNVNAVAAGENNLGVYIISGTYKDNGNDIAFTANVTEELLNNLIIMDGITVTLNTLTVNIWPSLLISFLPTILILGVFIFFMMRQGGGNSKAFDFGKSTAQMSRNRTVTFKDVAGCDEEKDELVEIIDFLKNPKKYSDIGARIPKGVLLFGPPGTGKTLLAKAVAGEAGVPFFSISGSDFVEMFVGVGASRVRDMFKTAKQNSPCIIFIDEIDAVGRQRGAGMGGGHDEREQTLNQLLVEMDGFNGNLGIIVMAATNRPDVLDPALLRPGRFDRQITISNPDVVGRAAILRVHARNKHLEENVNLDAVAQRIPGFSGADIENLLNEAALLAARSNRKVINTQDIDEAMDRVMLGPAKRSRKISAGERNTVAHHEAGHAVVGLKIENANIVQKVTIVPRGQAGGYALMMPEEERYLETKQSLLDKITGYLAGRVSEEVNFGEISTGASDDFKRATQIARAMVTEYGMSSLGPLQYEEPQGSVFLGRDYLKDKNFSDQVALEIDRETRSIIEECYARAKKIITEHLDLVKAIASYLLKVETLTKSDIDEINATGHLSWYDKKEEERLKAEQEAKTKEEKAKEETLENKEEDSTESMIDINNINTDFTKKDNE